MVHQGYRSVQSAELCFWIEDPVGEQYVLGLESTMVLCQCHRRCLQLKDPAEYQWKKLVMFEVRRKALLYCAFVSQSDEEAVRKNLHAVWRRDCFAEVRYCLELRLKTNQCNLTMILYEAQQMMVQSWDQCCVYRQRSQRLFVHLYAEWMNPQAPLVHPCLALGIRLRLTERLVYVSQRRLRIDQRRNLCWKGGERSGARRRTDRCFGFTCSTYQRSDDDGMREDEYRNVCNARRLCDTREELGKYLKKTLIQWVILTWKKASAASI